VSKPIQLQHVGRLDNYEQELYFLSLPDISSLPDSISLPSRHFIAFVAADVTAIEASVLGDFCRQLFGAGCVYFSAWGPDCKRLHDIFDEECYDVEPVIMTTWHNKESLDSALWFFVTSAYPDEGYSGTTRNALVISIGNPQWDQQLIGRLADIDSLKKEVLNED
jgi:hypothetical protein